MKAMESKIPVITQDGKAHGWCRLPIGRGFVIEGIFCPVVTHPEHGYECLLVKTPEENPLAGEDHIKKIIDKLPGITYPGGK